MDAALLLGRLLLASFFVVEGWSKIREFSRWVEVVRSVGLPWPRAEMALVVGLLTTGTLSLVLGFYTRVGLTCLLVFLLPTALIFESRGGAIRCLSIAGGLVCVLGVGPGAFSLDAYL